MTLASTLLAVTPKGKIIQDPSSSDVADAASLHVLAFSSKGHLLLNESEGRLDFETWELVRQQAASICQGAATTGSDGDTDMDDGTSSTKLNGFVREAVEDHLHKEYSWKIESTE